MDINIMVMLLGLLVLHFLFAFKAFRSQVHISTNKKWFWCFLSLLFGPLGYYSYHGFIPLDAILKE